MASLWPGMYHSPMTNALWEARSNFFEVGGDGCNGGDEGEATVRSHSWGVKFRRKASLFKEFCGDYLDVPSQPNLMNLMKKHGDSVFFADTVLKFTNSGKIKRRILMVTDSAVYIIDPETHALKSLGVARSPDEAASFAQELDEAGVVLLFGDKVYLHPDKHHCTRS